MSWHVYATCGLCSAKTPTFTDDDSDVAGAQADAAAIALGWVQVGLVVTDERRRHPGWVCKPCAGDVAGAFLEAGRRVQRPEPLPALDAPAPPDGIAPVGLFAGLSQEEIAEQGVCVAALRLPPPRLTPERIDAALARGAAGAAALDASLRGVFGEADPERP